MKKEGVFWCIIFLASVFVFLAFVQAGNIMTVEVNVFEEVQQPAISIEVPDYLFLGNVSKGQLSDEVRVDVNNTGTSAIVVTPQLDNQIEEILSYLQFRTRKSSSDPSLNIPYRIGEYHLNISAPSTPGGKKAEYFYMRLNLTNYAGQGQDIIGHRADVVFVAVAQ